MHFSQIFLNMDISLNTEDPDMKFELCIHQIYMQGSMSQNFDLGPSFCLIKSRKLSLKKGAKVSPFFYLFFFT